MHSRRTILATLTGLAVTAGCATARSLKIVRPSTLWSRENLVAWCVVPGDTRNRGPEERAEMLQRLGFRHFAYDWRQQHVPTFDDEIEALKKRGIDLLAWWFPFDADDPLARATLETFQRRGVRPQIWVPQSMSGQSTAGMQEELRRRLPADFPRYNPGDFDKLSEGQKKVLVSTYMSLTDERQKALLSSPAARQAELDRETRRIKALVELARPYGVKIALYNHNGWYGIMENQLAILRNLEAAGMRDVGLAYNFSHARDANHDDTADFLAIWSAIKPHVWVVNVAGTHMEDGTAILPSAGDRELDMMRVIQASGWRGHVGVIVDIPGDSEVILGNALRGLDWLAAEVAQPGSGGPRPFAQASRHSG